VRAAVDAVAAVRTVWLPRGRVFDAAVDVCAPVIDVDAHRQPTGNGRPWSSYLARAFGAPDVALDTGATIGSLTTPTAGFRDQYYGLVGAIAEANGAVHNGVRPLVTAGLVDLGRCAWGERPARFAKQRWRAPVVDLERACERPAAAAWLRRTAVPKVVVATQTRVVEAAVDEAGAWVPSVPLVMVPAPREQLWRVAAALCAPPVSAWVAHRTAGTALAQGAIKVSARLVRAIPLPVDEHAWDRGAAALRDGDLDGFGVAMTRAYRATDDALTWWQARR
jgi:hypothetical protein